MQSIHCTGSRRCNSSNTSHSCGSTLHFSNANHHCPLRFMPAINIWVFWWALASTLVLIFVLILGTLLSMINTTIGDLQFWLSMACVKTNWCISITTSSLDIFHHWWKFMTWTKHWYSRCFILHAVGIYDIARVEDFIGLYIGWCFHYMFTRWALCTYPWCWRLRFVYLGDSRKCLLDCDVRSLTSTITHVWFQNWNWRSDALVSAYIARVSAPIANK